MDCQLSTLRLFGRRGTGPARDACADSRPGAKTWALLLTAVYIACGMILVAHHEMWRDELQAWLIARDSVNLRDLFAHLKYEGHPGLWYLCLWPLTHHFPTPAAMQYFHLGIAAASVYVLARYSPFSRTEKVLIAFGYFFFYEYAVISRNYAPAVLLVFSACALFPRRYARPVSMAVVLGLLAHTNVLGTIMSLALGGALVLEWLLDRSHGVIPARPARWHVLAAFIFVAAVAAAVMQMNPPGDSGFAVGWRFAVDAKGMKDLLKALVEAYLPLPKFKLHFWNSNVFISRSPIPNLLLAGGLIYLFGRGLRHRPAALAFFVGCTGAMLAFFYVKLAGATRHHGFLFIAVIAAVWLGRLCREVKGPRMFPQVPGLSAAHAARLFTVVLVIHVLGGLTAALQDYRKVFSNAMQTARFLRVNNLQDALIVGNTDFTASAVNGYLDPRQFFYPMGNRFGSFVVWDNRRAPVDEATFLATARELGHRQARQVVLIVNQRLSPSGRAQAGIEALGEFTGSVVRDEDYFIYRLSESE